MCAGFGGNLLFGEVSGSDLVVGRSIPSDRVLGFARCSFLLREACDRTDISPELYQVVGEDDVGKSVKGDLGLLLETR